MPIVASDIKAYLSGGFANTSPNNSLGGGISGTPIISNKLNNLFDRVGDLELTLGDVEYRCFYIKNEHGSLSLLAATIWISSNTPSPDSTISIGLGTSGILGTEQTIGNESTTPVGVSFSAPTSLATGLIIGNLPSNGTKAIWVRRTITASASLYANDRVTINISGDTLP